MVQHGPLYRDGTGRCGGSSGGVPLTAAAGDMHIPPVLNRLTAADLGRPTVPPKTDPASKEAGAVESCNLTKENIGALFERYARGFLALIALEQPPPGHLGYGRILGSDPSEVADDRLVTLPARALSD